MNNGEGSEGVLLSRRRWLAGVAALAASGLVGCGFALRRAPEFAFERIYLGFTEGSTLGQALRRAFATTRVQVVDARQIDSAQVFLDALGETREKVVVALSSTGQVREFELRYKLRYKVRSVSGVELVGPTDLEVRRELSFNESNVLAKDTEETLLYRDMQNDLVQQLMRRLAALR